MRLFIAIEFSELREYLAGIQSQLPVDIARLTMPKSFHLTLKFLGEVSEGRLDAIRSSLRNVSFAPLKVSLGSIGFFPNESYIRVVWVGFEDGGGIISLQSQIDDALSALFRREKDFHPHITLARVKFVKDKQNFVTKLSQIKIEKHQAQVSSFKLIKSALTPNGPVYEDLETFLHT